MVGAALTDMIGSDEAKVLLMDVLIVAWQHE
mgnify:CR=1 FL=1